MCSFLLCSQDQFLISTGDIGVIVSSSGESDVCTVYTFFSSQKNFINNKLCKNCIIILVTYMHTCTVQYYILTVLYLCIVYTSHWGLYTHMYSTML